MAGKPRFRVAAMSEDPLDRTVTFGRYRGQATWRQVAERDPGYAEWLVRVAERTPDDVRELLMTCIWEQDPGDWDERFLDMGAGWEADEY
jgi:hypothetical protein